jgi:integrase/recombinase XerC
MDPITSLHARPKAWLLHSVLAPHADVFVSYLTHARYSAQSRNTYVASLAHLARWMSQCCLPLSQLNEAAVELFLDRHVPRCDCPRPVVRTHSALRAACAHLLKVLREQKVIVERAGATGPIAEELDRYDAHLREARGLSEGTRRSGLRLVQRLLRYKFTDGPVVFAQLQPEDLRRFIATQLELRGTSSNATALTSALRGYLRYRTSCGDRVHALAGVIASPAHWSLASLPRRCGPSKSSAYSAASLRRYPRPDAATPWCAVRWTWVCAAAKWPSYNSLTLIGVPER